MQKIVYSVLLSFSFFSLCGEAPSQDYAFVQFKKELVETFHAADQQSEWLNALMNHKEIDLSELSLTDVEKTVAKLESHIERLFAKKKQDGKLGEQESRCLALAQELVRQLTNARLSYQQRINSEESVKKIAISAGAAVAVFGGLMVLNLVTPLDISLSTALMCGIATGCVVGIITHIDPLMHRVRSVSNLVHDSLPQSSWNIGLKTVTAVGVVALASGVAWVNKEALFGGISSKKRPQKSLENMIKGAGLADDRAL